jgi:putative ATPase
MAEQGYGRGYRYAHDDPDAASSMVCLPESLGGRRYYRPGDQGAEPELSRQHRVRTGRK